MSWPIKRSPVWAWKQASLSPCLKRWRFAFYARHPDGGSVKTSSPLASWPCPLGRNRYGGHGYSRACIYTSGIGKGCSHMKGIWKRAEEREGGSVVSQSRTAANTGECRCLMTNYLCIHYDNQQFEEQWRSNKSIWTKRIKTEKNTREETYDLCTLQL